MMGEPHSHSYSHTHTHHGSQHDSLTSPEDEHDLSTWKGLVAALGLVFFFFTEKCLTLVGEWRKQRQRRRKVGTVTVSFSQPEHFSNVLNELFLVLMLKVIDVFFLQSSDVCWRIN
jgi:hypothetical protein